MVAHNERQNLNTMNASMMTIIMHQSILIIIIFQSYFAITAYIVQWMMYITAMTVAVSINSINRIGIQYMKQENI